MSDSEAREMARDLVRGSIIEDAAAQFIAQILKHAHDERIKPLQARLTAAEAEVEKLRGKAAKAAKAAYVEGFLDGAADGWVNNPRIELEWKRSKTRATLITEKPHE